MDFLFSRPYSLLFGLFFTNPVHSVQRWYKLPFIGIYFQPSEYAKLSVIFTLGGWFLEKKKDVCQHLSTSFLLLLIVAVPFLLILKQPDLGTALVLFPITLVMCFFGEVHKKVLASMMVLRPFSYFFCRTMMFSGVVFS